MTGYVITALLIKPLRYSTHVAYKWEILHREYADCYKTYGEKVISTWNVTYARIRTRESGLNRTLTCTLNIDGLQSVEKRGFFFFIRLWNLFVFSSSWMFWQKKRKKRRKERNRRNNIYNYCKIIKLFIVKVKTFSRHFPVFFHDNREKVLNHIRRKKPISNRMNGWIFVTALNV